MPHATPASCPCAACHLRRQSPALVLIALGGLLLVNRIRPAFGGVSLVAAFFVFCGALLLAQRLLPGPRAGSALAAAHPPRGPLFFPLLLLALGILILVRHALAPYPLGAWIAHYWPVLLILWGLSRLIEHYTSPRARAGLSAGEILLVVLIVLVGLSFSGVYSFGHSRMANYWGIDVEGWNPFLQSYAFSASSRAPLGPGPAPALVVVRGYRGDVILVPGPAGSVSAAVNDTVRADGRSAAGRIFQNAQPLIRAEASRLLVLPAGEDSPAAVEADLTLTLPASLPVLVQLENGAVTIPDWRADLDVHTTHGAVTITRLTGNLRVSSGHDSVNIDQVAGNVGVSGDGDDVAISRVSGDVTLAGEFVGSLSFRDLARGLRFNSSRTSLALAALPGSLSADMGRIVIADARGVQLRTRDEAIELDRCVGPIEIHDRNQPVTVSAVVSPADPITVVDRNADLTLRLPSGSRFHLVAAAHNGEVRNDFGAAGSDPAAPTFALQTTNGSIELSRHP